MKPGAAVVGIDAGVKDLLVVAGPAGNEVERHRAPRALKQAHRKLRALQRKAARQVGPWDETTRREQDPSKGWQRTRREIGRAHARVANLRIDRLHKLTHPAQPDPRRDRRRNAGREEHDGLRRVAQTWP